MSILRFLYFNIIIFRSIFICNSNTYYLSQSNYWSDEIKTRWVGNVADMVGGEKALVQCLSENLKGRDRLQTLVVDGG
jgi:hypothetical protein